MANLKEHHYRNGMRVYPKQVTRVSTPSNIIAKLTHDSNIQTTDSEDNVRSGCRLLAIPFQSVERASESRKQAWRDWRERTSRGETGREALARLWSTIQKGTASRLLRLSKGQQQLFFLELHYKPGRSYSTDY